MRGNVYFCLGPSMENIHHSLKLFNKYKYMLILFSSVNIASMISNEERRILGSSNFEFGILSLFFSLCFKYDASLFTKIEKKSFHFF